MQIRLDKFLALKNPKLSRSLIQKYIKLGYVKINKTTSFDASKTIDEDSKVNLKIPNKKNYKKNLIPVIYENSDIIVIDKPTGVLSHSKGALNDEFTVADFFKPITKYNKATNRPGIIHRLDRDTSGVMIGVKNDSTAKLISRQFSDRTIKKTYYAIVEGCPKNNIAIIDMPISRNPKLPSQFRVDANGKSAKTEYKVIKSNKKLSLVELKPSTGRTHQLRVHMSHIGHPILGDRVYGHQSNRLYLHAYSLELTIPGSDRKIFISKIPESFEEVLSK